MITRESLSKSKVSTQVPLDSIAVSDADHGGQGEKEKKKVLVVIDDEICGAILDVSFQRMLKKNALPALGQSLGALELWNEDFDGKVDFSQYRSRLVIVIPLILFCERENFAWFLSLLTWAIYRWVICWILTLIKSRNVVILVHRCMYCVNACYEVAQWI